MVVNITTFEPPGGGGPFTSWSVNLGGASGGDGSSGSSGSSGTSGAVGSSGSSGTSGINGSSGSSGTSGTRGSSGSSGTSGINGSSGSSGTSGINGSSGSSGTSGVNGSSGSSGTSGINGSSGSSGTSGINGSSGSSGTSGTRGSSGSSGTSGINGSSGSSGTSGTRGSSGSSGTSGINGSSGSSGTSGINGSSGSSGTSGVNGSSGSSGTSGTRGSSGSSGTSGVNGSSGSSGTSGINGSSGSSGTSGINGSSGSSGTSGTRGSSGSSGTSGINGSSGSSGTSGVSGSSGSSGTSFAASGTINHFPYWNSTNTLSSTSSIQTLKDSIGIGNTFSNTGNILTDYRLHIQYTGTYGVLIEGGGGMPENLPLRLWDSGTGANNINVFEFGHATGSAPNRRYVPGARIKSTNPGSGATTGAHLILETSPLSDPTSTTWNTNQLYLRNNGNIGIGTNLPNSYLTINTPGGTTWSGSSNALHAISIGSQSTGSDIFNIGVDDNIAAAYMQASVRGGAAIPILFNPSGGNVGIGLTAPSAKLQIATTIPTIPLMIASGSTTVDMVRITQVGTGNALVVEDGTNPDSNPFVVNNLGDVGIGLTVPSNKLHIRSNTLNSTVVRADGVSGELLTVTDNLIGSLFSVNDISGIPVFEVFSDSTLNLGDYQAPALYTTTKVTKGPNLTNSLVYQFNASTYTSAYFDYNVISGTNSRAGSIMAVWNSAGSLEYNEVSTLDIGNTLGTNAIDLNVALSGTNVQLRTTTSAGQTWIIKAIIRAI